MRKHVADYSVDAFFFLALQAHPHSDEGHGDTNWNNMNCGGRST